MSMYELEKAFHQAWIDGAFGLKTVYENFKSTPPTGEPWARVTFAPAQPIPTGLGDTGEDEVVGLYIVDLNYPLGEGNKRALEAYEAIRVYFKAGRKFTNGTTTAAIISAGRLPAQIVDQNYRLTVQIEFEARISRA